MAMLCFLRELHCETAGEFIDNISPFGKNFGPSAPRDWLFRGHGDAANYKLLPKALRPELVDDLHELAQTPELARQHKNVSISQWLAEASLLLAFAEAADRVGLALPGQSARALLSLHNCAKKLSRQLETYVKSPPEKPTGEKWMWWPVDDVVPLIALAQHHGLPTCFLDWTFDPYVALYFAARDSIDHNTATIGIWAIHGGWFSRSEEVRDVLREIAEVKIHFPSTLTADNPNLLAQSGMFHLVIPKCCHPGAIVDRTPLGTRLRELQRFATCNNLETKESGESTVLAYHFTLPGTRAAEMLWYIAKIGIDAARLFPGFDGVARALKDRADQRQP